MIRIEHVSKVIKNSEILKDISLEMDQGVIYGFEGYNGSGKTMLMRTIAGLIYPTEGEIYINDVRLTHRSEYPASIGILIENPAFLAGYTGLENLKILASIRNEISEREIRQCITEVGLEPDDKRKYKKYSLGMKQRLGIAAAIMEKPDILILDEPINALDKDGVEMVKRLILQEKKRGALVILSCHDAGFLGSVSDVLYYMDQGKLTADTGGAYAK